MKVGIDLVELKRIKKLLKKKKLQKVYSKTEIENINNCSHPVQRAGGYFAVKEAVLKAFEVGLYNGISLSEISITYSENGAPKLELNKKIKSLMQYSQVNEIEISISHTEKFAVAICTLI